METKKLSKKAIAAAALANVGNPANVANALLNCPLLDVVDVSLTSEPPPASNEPVSDTIEAPDRFMYITSLKLRRSVLNGTVKHCKIVVPEDCFRSITAAGLSYGVTWDEMLRALLTEQAHQPMPFKSTAKFLPLV